MSFGIIKGDPSHSRLQLAPPGGTFPVCFLHDGENPNTREIPGSGIVGSRAFTDVKIWDGHLHQIRKGWSRRVQNSTRGIRYSASIILGQVVPLNEIAEFVHITEVSGITAVLDDLHRFLVIPASGKALIPFAPSFLRAQKVSRVVGHGILHTGIFAEIRRNRHIASILVLLLGRDGMDRTAIPGGAHPGVARQGSKSSSVLLTMASSDNRRFLISRLRRNT